MNDPTIGERAAATPLLLLLGIILGICVLLLPRRYALLPVIAAACFLPVSGKLILGGVTFSMLRLIVLFGLARVIFRNELRRLRWLSLDSAVALWTVWRVIAFTILWLNGSAIVNALGYAFDDLGLYLFFRALIHDHNDFVRVIKAFAWALIPVALLMCVERVSGTNPFHLLGGVPDSPELRQGVIRCQGAFGHPILAGTFGTVWVGLFIGVWLQGGRSRIAAVLGILAATLICFTSGSSGPIVSYFAALFGLAMWKLRNNMRLVRWGIVAGILGLHLIMKDPVWFVFARIDVFSGSTGWHRANLIDRMIAHFGDWWLLGARDISNWGIWAGDTTNQYIAEGVRGGVFTMLLFVWIIVIAFSYLGVAVKAARKESRQHQLLLWALGVAIFTHVVSYLSVAYFDQNIVNWYLALAMAAAAFQLSKTRQAPELAVTLTPDLGSEAELPELTETQPTEFIAEHSVRAVSTASPVLAVN